VRSSQWKAAVASHAPPPASLAGDRRPAQDFSRRDDEETHDGALFALERSEFALRPRTAPPGGSPSARQVPPAVSTPAPGATLRAATPRNPILSRDLLSLREPFDASEIEPPHFERELRPDTVTPIPVERAVLLSLIAHVLLLLILLWAPVGTPSSNRGFLAQLYPEPKPDDKIPLVFRSAPGPERENPKRSDLSDKSRRAGGGDRSRPKADTPYVPRNRGVEGLAPGQNRIARAAPPPPPAAPARPAEKAASGAAGEQAKPADDGFRVPPPGAGASGEATQSAANLQQAIQDAARQVGARGQGGAGNPNPDGGFVDSGPISFDTSWYDWGPYAEEMVRRIKLHWEIPDLARLGWKGRLTVRFYILADGTVEGAQYLSHSGTPPFDFAAFNAILKSSPFKPLPKDLLAQIPGKDREGVTVTFFYNIRPEDEGRLK
jgi:TonB family protein